MQQFTNFIRLVLKEHEIKFNRSDSLCSYPTHSDAKLVLAGIYGHWKK